MKQWRMGLVERKRAGPMNHFIFLVTLIFSLHFWQENWSVSTDFFFCASSSKSCIFFLLNEIRSSPLCVHFGHVYWTLAVSWSSYVC